MGIEPIRTRPRAAALPLALAATLLALQIAGCAAAPAGTAAPPDGAAAGRAGLAPAAPSGVAEAPWDFYRDELPPPAVPADNPWTEAKFVLGRRLFHDPALSVNGTKSCASCHFQALAFSDGRGISLGATGELNHRNSQGLVNVAWNATLTWANPTLLTLEQQIVIPLFGHDPVEMGLDGHSVQAMLARLREDADYVEGFRAAFGRDDGDGAGAGAGAGRDDGDDPVTSANVVKALASFMRGIVSAESRFDRHRRGELELTAAELRGKELFFGEQAGCHRCHGSFNFNDQMAFAGARPDTPFHNMGLYDVDGRGGYPAPNRGLFEHSNRAADMGAFRAPSLRNVVVTAPYMHDGSVATLAEVLEIYAAGGRMVESGPHPGDGRRNAHRSELMAAIRLSAQDRADLLAFLGTLTDECVLHSPRFADPAAAYPMPRHLKCRSYDLPAPTSP